MIRQISLAIVASTLSLSAAMAADPIAPIMDYADDPTDWSGFYAGVHGGLLSASFTSTSSSATHELEDFDPLEGRGALLGVNAGVDHQFDTFVLGLEGEVNWTNVTASYVSGDPEWHADIDWYAAISGKAGLAWDQVLFYGKAGLAIGGLSLVGIDNVSPANSPTTATNVNLGYLVGAGVELAASENVSLFVEGNLVTFRPAEFDITGTGFHAVEQMGATAAVAKVGIRIRN